ncbi:hypothetical protein SPD48_12860 [Pseudogracilibacillus sp. SE30717A]|uniref:hypothetical protein n=1 Tax=Pseudogracilibacillus sp. SE30717A TaxID=3098293 RepID=UPI00300E053A
MNRDKILLILKWLLFLFAIGLFFVQMGYLLLQDRLQMEYVDNRLFYILNILIVVCLYVAIIMLFSFKRNFHIIGASLVSLFIILNVFLLTESNKEIKNIVSISPNLTHVFSIKEDQQLDEALYYRSYYRIVSRPKERLPSPITGDYDVRWLTNDVAVFTYETTGDKKQAFIGTYGDRNEGVAYYYVGAEIQGVWENEDVSVVSSPDEIQVIENGNTTVYDWDQIHQFGTLAIVLEKEQEADWVIALGKDFKLRSVETGNSPAGSIILYKVGIENKEVDTLNYKSLQ